ncbi:feruloyl esterase b [Penicillium brasilianum]|uniref:Carboxylic ester hydrolase n=1 Tax=Penicillium brasilianum TaxID=104259 RepID=A0A1S9RV32_PENBI|nr:feruloyl esterase b [Penicillium brasilianum]
MLATDAGLTKNGIIDASSGLWALNSDGSLNSGLLTNFAYRSIHDMNVIAKLILRMFYGHAEQYPYYYGCSTGGRQGYLSATHYPTDFDGILAISPAINTPQVSPADFWPSVVLGNEVVLPPCVFSAYQDAIIKYCDGLDRVWDGLISMYNPDSCTFEPSSLVGQSIVCSDTNSSITITSEDAGVIRKILQGPTGQDGELLCTAVVNGSLVVKPFQAAEYWIQNFVFQNPTYPALNMTYQDFQTAFDLSVEKFSAQFGTLQPDLHEFRRGGGKLLTWHGLADQYIAHAGTVRYWNATKASMSGAEQVNGFYRLFLAPGAAHCGGGSGPVPVNPLAALAAWVENDTAPETLFASTTNTAGQNVTRGLCPYPAKLVYSGGDVNQASSFICR